MPWEKSFDEELALNKAMQVFWKKGFKSTSIADLIKGTGVNRGSLYNAFGGKQALFETVLVKYDRDRRRTRLAELEALNNPKQAIFNFFDTLVTDTLADTEKKGCFLINSASEISNHDEHVAGIIRNGIREIEAFFRRCIEVGQVRGMIRTELNPEATANALLANLVAIRVLGRGTLNEGALRSIANTAKQSIV
ncbi:MAG: TetR/AcrR family transcriptional regulator [Gammaproteobacteria bacterium]